MNRLAFSPIKIGPIEVANRIVRTAHGTCLSNDEISDDSLAYHVARAKGGCGLTILEASGVHWSSAITQSVANDTAIKGLRRLVEGARPYGMKIFQQLWHGGNVYPSCDGTPPWAVSLVPGATGVVGHPMTVAQIAELQDAFVAAALRVRTAGLDGVEIHAAHGYLFQQFLSPIYNDRSDQYGGSEENRWRFLRETLRKVRDAVGGQIAVGIRIGVSEAPGGLSVDDIRPLVAALEAERLVDYVSASLGDYYRMATFYGTMESPVGYELPTISQLTRGIQVPRMVTGRFRTVDEVEQVIRDGVADMVSMVRAQIADPELVRKTMEGRVLEIRPCIACNQGCVGGYIRDHRMGCAVNAAAGFERSLAEDLIRTTSRPRSVLVVGGGPAGMEAARVAALRGHSVTLAEASGRLGGAVEIAKKVPRYLALGDITTWLESEIFRLGVKVRLGTFMEASDIRAFAPDVLIVATGSVPRMDGFQVADPGEPAIGCSQKHVVSAADLIVDTSRDLGKSALVLDTVGHFEGLAASEFLLSRGLSVTFVTHHGTMSPYVDTTLRTVPSLERLYGLGEFSVLVHHHLIEIKQSTCRVRPLWARNKEAELPADTVVLVTQNEPLRELFDELNGEIRNCHLIGDASSPRDIQVAIREGHRTSRSLE